MANSRRTRSEWFYLITAVIMVAGFVFWQSDLTSDPPMYFSGIGQSLSTDPYMYSFHARNKILFGEFDPFDDPRWIVFERSLVSICSYLWLSVTGVTLREANTVGLLLSVAGLFLIVLGLTKHHRPWVTSIVALTYLMNVTLLTYGRLPYLENGLIFLSGLMFLLFVRWGHRLRGTIACGIVIALAMLTGKVFGVLLLPALILAILVTKQPGRWKLSLAAIGSFTLTAGALAFLLYGAETGEAVGFFSFQSLGLHGFPEGLTSPLAFFEHLVAFGFENRLFYLNPDVLLCLTVGGVLLACFLRSNNAAFGDLPPAINLSLFWILCVWIGVMPLNYSPLRYSLLLIPAILVFCFTTMDYCLSARKRRSIALRGKGVAIMIILFWIVTFHVIMNAVFFNEPDAPRRLILWFSLAGGVVVAFSLKWLLGSRFCIFSRSTVAAMLIGLLGVSVVVNSFRIRRKHYLDHHFSIVEANQDVNQILSKNAVIAGPYAPAMTFQTNHQSLIHFFGAAKEDSRLFDRYPITHIAADQPSWGVAVTRFPPLGELKPVASYWIRDYQVQLFNVSKTFSNPQANAYVESDFERAAAYYNKGQFDSALAVLNATPEIISTSKAAGILYSELLRRNEQYEHVLRILLALAARYPTDFSIQLQCGHFLQQVALARKDRAMLLQAQKHYEKATILNPYRAEFANTLYIQTLARQKRQTAP